MAVTAITVVSEVSSGFDDAGGGLWTSKGGHFSACSIVFVCFV